MTRLNLFLLPILGILSSPAGLASTETPGSTPHTYAQCTELELTDQACHQQIIEAGGTIQTIPDSTRSITAKNFRGWSDQERWYRKYVEYCKRALIKPKPMEDVIDHYPGFPVNVPYYLVYP